jgi:hypothetical protein
LVALDAGYLAMYSKRPPQERPKEENANEQTNNNNHDGRWR